MVSTSLKGERHYKTPGLPVCGLLPMPDWAPDPVDEGAGAENANIRGAYSGGTMAACKITSTGNVKWFSHQAQCESFARRGGPVLWGLFLNGRYGMVGSDPQRISFGHCYFFIQEKNVFGKEQESPSLCEFCDSEFKWPVIWITVWVSFLCGVLCVPHCPFKYWDQGSALCSICIFGHSVTSVYLESVLGKPCALILGITKS